MLLRRHILSQSHRPPIQFFARAFKNNYSNGKLTPEPVHGHNTEPQKVQPQGNTVNAVDSGVQAYKVSVNKSMTGNLVNKQAFRQALLSNDPSVIEDVVKDYLRLHNLEKVDPKTRNFLTRPEVLRNLSLDTLLAVLSAIRPLAIILPPSTITPLVYRLTSPKQPVNVAQHLTLIYPHILFHLQQLRSAKSHAVRYTPPDIVRSAFKFLNAFLPTSERDALGIFTILTNTYHIPSSTMVESSSSQTLQQAISVSLVKASLYWNWYDIAEDMMSHLFLRTPAPDSFLIRQATDCLYALLMSPSLAGLRRCLNLIHMLHPHAPVPDSLIRQFYDAALDIDATELARDLYEFTKDVAVLKTHSYPAPQGRALTWLMTYLTGKGRRVQLARALASDVVEHGLLLPMNQRAQFISVVARRGFASSARALWERYGNGKDGVIIYGNPSILISMTKLFMYVSRTQEAQGETTLSNETRSFAYDIMDKFKQHHSPWDTANHRILTSYARVCFIVGKNMEGFRIFKTLLRRRELPDMYDINVVLSAIAERAPSAAAKMLLKMERLGVQPDAVSIGTVLHNASVQGREKVVEEMIQRAMKIENIHLDVKAFGALIRGVAHTGDTATPEERNIKLKVAWGLVRAFTECGTQPSPEIGNYLVTAALKAGNGLLAYRFWKALLKENTDYDDIQQTFQRRGIMLKAIQQNILGEIGGMNARTIIRELNERETR